MFLAPRCINISGKRLVDMKINANILFFNDTKLNDMIKIDFYQMMKFCKMQQRTFRFFISYRSCGRSCNDYHIQTTIEYTFM